MELKRGKTFIKSSQQISHEKPPDPGATTLTKADIDPCPASLGGQQWLHGEKVFQASSSAQGHDICPSKGAQPSPEGVPMATCGATFKLVRKSKTHENISGAGRTATTTEQLTGSSSFPGPPSGQRMIDYRHFVPQMPFVPAVAKCIPRKRISLKRPKKCFRNLFHIRRNKTENSTALAATRKSLSSPQGPSLAAGQRDPAFLSLGEGLGLDSLGQDLSDNELLPDSSFDLCRVLCEDAASLKSFDSLTGCGEIFADESSVPSLVLSDGPESPAQGFQALESKASRGFSQGSVEQLASPTQKEMSDFTKFWDSVNRSVRQQHRALLGPWVVDRQGRDLDQPRLDVAKLAEVPLFPCRGPSSGSKASSIDTGTPKSEQPESVSTSDEGYYDSFSPGLEEEKKEAQGPSTPSAAFPRDSYSGDALYELFYDPSEGPIGPSLDDDLCVSESLSGPALGTPLSMCSFHVGAEENLAPAPGPDLLTQGFLQSSWKGKECLLKLCDTELAITMGIVNWLRRTPPAPASAPASAPTPAPGEPEVPPSPCKALWGPEKLGGKADRASGSGRATVCSAPSSQELWAHLGTKGPLARENKVPGDASKAASTPCQDPSLEEGTRGLKSSLSFLGSIASAPTNTSKESKAPSPPGWPSFQESRPPGDLRQLQRSQRPGHGGETLDAGPMLEAPQTHPDAQPSGQDEGRVLSPDILQQKQTDRSLNGVSVCCLPSSASPRGQRFVDPILDLSQLRLEPTRMGSQANASIEDLHLQLSPWAAEQAAHRSQLDPGPSSTPAAQQSPREYSPGILSLSWDSQR